jgi:hypothetical protein
MAPVVRHVLDRLAGLARLVLDEPDVVLGLLLAAVDDQPARALRQVLPQVPDAPLVA